MTSEMPSVASAWCWRRSCGDTGRCAQQYAARRNGDVVQLEDTKNQTVVSIITSVGNDRVRDEGQRAECPAVAVRVHRRVQGASPTLHGIPFLGPWANRLDEQAFYANGKRYAFDMELGNVRGAIPIHGFLTRPISGRSSR